MKSATRAWDLANILDSAPAGVKILSLDCFDTLLWRNMNLPADLFADLGLPGGGMEARIWGETRARRTVPYRDGRSEVTIDEIYANMLPAATPQERGAAVERELAAEAAHCYGFAPTRDLMAEAKRRGLKVIIVSDTYLSEPRLRALITAAAGEEVAGMIDRIFCSCEYGVGKGGGLFTHVLAELGASPGTILHVGDNQMADQTAPDKLGIHSVHLRQFDAESDQRLRQEASIASLIDPTTRVTVPAWQPHRPQVALRRDDSGAAVLGHDVLGPLMTGFADWLREEVAAQDAATGKPTKLLFLLRDGFLPAHAFAARHPDLAARTLQVEISRFTAAAASFTDAAAIERCVLPEIHVGSLPVFARQLLLDRDEATKLGRLTKPQFAKAITDPARVRHIVRRSGEFRERLFAYLAAHGVERGDSVMLVDLGYNGSVQNFLGPVLESELGLTVTGRYLLLRETIRSGHDKSGFIDHRNHDLKLLHALSESIALIEQVCTVAQGSVVDYRKDGTPVRKAVGVKGAQSAMRDAIQSACLDYVAHADTGVVKPAASDNAEARRRMCVAILARLLFLPMASEVALFADFAHDVNLGTDDMLQMLDRDAAAKGLRRRGLFYIKNAARMYLPGELRDHGLPINLSIFASRRFGLDFRKQDFDVGAIPLPVMLMDASGEHVVVDVDAVPTVDGYYQALIPVGECRYTAGIQLGRIAEWVQVEEASFHEVEQFLDAKGEEEGRPATMILEAMAEAAPGLHRCEGEASFVLVPPPAVTAKGAAMLLSFVFRPVVTRAKAAAGARVAA
ncbi:MAG: HAD family hydrolase [Sphingobium sp.]